MPDEAAVIREGICWPAVFFGPLWALRHGLWFVAAGLAAALIGLGLAGSLLRPDPATAAAALIGFMLLVGWAANDWRRGALEDRGWRMAGLAAADGPDAALFRYLETHPADVAVPPDGTPPTVDDGGAPAPRTEPE